MNFEIEGNIFCHPLKGPPDHDFKFKYLFVALEKIANIDGNDRTDDDFDNDVWTK